MSETPSLTQGLQSCPSTQVLLQKAKLPGTCWHLGTETEPLVGLGVFLLCQGTPSSPWSQLLMLAADRGPASVILGEEVQESQLFPRAGECVAGWPEESAPGMPCQGAQQEKRTLVMQDFQPGHPVEPIVWLRVRVHLPQVPPTCGVQAMQHSHPVSASNAAPSPSPGSITHDPKASRQHTAPRNTRWKTREGKRNPKTGEDLRLSHPQPPVPRQRDAWLSPKGT